MSSRKRFKKRSVASLFEITFAAILITCGLALPIRAQGQPQQPNGNLDADLETGNDLLRRHRYEDALKSFKRVNESHGKTCAECLFGMAEAYFGLEAYKTVAETCEKIFALAPDTKLLAKAYNLKGIALQTQAGTKDQKKLQDAEAAFRKALALNVELPILYYNLGFTLMEMGRDAEGAVELKKYIELQPDNPKAENAAKLIENPRRAREAYSPDFSITTSDGEYVTVDDLRGKVVLLDFWGTWCPPCVASVPALRDLQKRFAKEPLFKMISVSNDSDEPKWRAFIEKNQMVWTQYLDRDHHVVRMFEVHAFPTYILLDAEGIVRFREITTSWEQSGTLTDAIKKYLKSAAKAGPSE
jgi:peroxiredoxin/Tfp pilus assembly protein PilF